MNILVFAILLIVPKVFAEEKRPLWIIGNMVNNINQIKEFIDLGANAIEADATFSYAGGTKDFYMGFPCDCGRNCFRWSSILEFLSYIHNETAHRGNEQSFGKRLVLFKILMQVSSLSKEAKFTAGENMVKALNKYYWKDAPEKVPYLQISLNTIEDAAFIKGFLKAMEKYKVPEVCRKNLGWDIKANEDETEIISILDNLKLDNVWLSDGAATCTNRGYDRLNELIHHRDTPNDITADKVYTWCYDQPSSMKDALMRTVDAIVVNYPDRTEKVLQENFFADHYRKATKEDYPWKRFEMSAKTKNVFTTYYVIRNKAVNDSKLHGIKKNNDFFYV